MTVRPWDPFAELMSMRRMLDRMYAEGFGRPPRAAGERPTGAFLPLDVYETGDSYVVKAPLPGARPEDVHVALTGHTLTIRADVQDDVQVVPDRYLYQERVFGILSREVELPAPVQVDKAEARFEHGVLILSLPKSEEARPRHIQVKTE